MPMFTFQVTKITKSEANEEIKMGKKAAIRARVTTITLV